MRRIQRFFPQNLSFTSRWKTARTEQNPKTRLVNRYLQILYGNGIWQSRPFLKDMTTWCRCEWQTGWEHGWSQFGTKGNWLIQIARLHLWPRMHFSLHQNTIGKKHILVLHTCLFLSPQEVCSLHHCRYLDPCSEGHSQKLKSCPTEGVHKLTDIFKYKKNW